MQMERVWNITDDPRNKHTPVTVTVLGKSVAPGTFVRVPMERLKSAHKLNKDAADKRLFIGRTPPKAYQDHKKPPKAELARGVSRAHGEVLLEKVEAPVVPEAPIVAELADEVLVEDTVIVEEYTESDESEDTYGGRKKKKKG